ncbi:MAG: flavodoxin domain-containing protein [Pseudomonadota bacterium]
MNVLIVYATIEGQTRKIVDRLAAHLKTNGHKVETIDAASAPEKLSIDAIDAVVCAGSVHMGHFPLPMRSFIKDHHMQLMARPGLFVTVSLTALEEDEAERAALDELVADFSKESGWWPVGVHHAAGALRYTQYDYFRKWMLKRIAAKKGSETDTSRDHEFTDWDALFESVDQFLRDVPELAGKI